MEKKIKDLSDFYHSILNIGQSNDEEYLIMQIEKIISDVRNIFGKNNESLERLCKIVSNYIHVKLNDLKIKNKIINTKALYNSYEHEFIICIWKDKKANIFKSILIDPTYIQFKKIENHTLNSKLKRWPSEILREKNNNLLCNLLKKGYSFIDDKGLNDYLESLNNELGQFISIDKLFFDINLNNEKKSHNLT